MIKKSTWLIVFGLFVSPVVFAQDEKMYAQFFPEPQYKIPVPIIRGDSVKNYYTSYKDAVNFIKTIAAKHSDVITISSIGLTQRGKDEIAILLNKKNTINDSLKVRTTFISGIHGNEPIASESMLYLMEQLVENKEYENLLDHVILQIIPMVNVDGRTADRRASSNGTDLNRDLAILNAPESANLKNAINTFNPHLVVDFHEYNPGRMDFQDLNDCLTPCYDALFLYTGNLNVNPSIRESIINNFVEPAKKFLEQNQRRVTNYCTTRYIDNELTLSMGGIESRSSATNYALQNRISILMEIRGLTEKEKASKRRIETSFLTAISYLNTANSNAEKIIATVRDANVETANSKRQIVVTSKPLKTVKSFTFIDVCKLEYRTIDFNTRDNLQQSPVLERERPAAYLIYPYTEKIKRLLNVSGVQFSEFKEAVSLNDVDCYFIRSSGKIKVTKKNLSVSSAAILIDMHQPMANVVVDLLEPEGSNSVYDNDFLKKLIDRKDDLLPVYRLNSEQLSQLRNTK